MGGSRSQTNAKRTVKGSGEKGRRRRAGAAAAADRPAEEENGATDASITPSRDDAEEEQEQAETQKRCEAGRRSSSLAAAAATARPDERGRCGQLSWSVGGRVGAIVGDIRSSVDVCRIDRVRGVVPSCACVIPIVSVT
jgi:hypothetical protein